MCKISLVVYNVQAIHSCISRRGSVARLLTDWFKKDPVLMSQQISTSQTIPGKLYCCVSTFLTGFKS
jgi:hypothetical protein